MARDIIALDSLTVNNLGTFQKINETCLPTRYNSSWYRDSLDPGQIVQLAYYTELPVGAVKAKAINTAYKIPTHEASLQTILNSKIIPNAVYVESLAVLDAYRHLGIGKKLVEYVVEETKQRFIHEIMLHVHVDNEDAMDFYLGQGFKKGDVVKNYYKDQQLANPDAIILALAI